MTRAFEDITLSIILVVYNTRDEIVNCLETLHRFPAPFPTEILVIDNASSDDSPEAVREMFPHVRLLVNEDNLGYSGGVNQGIRNAHGEFLLVLNPDISVHEGSLEALVRYMQAHPKIGIAGSKLLNPDGTVQLSTRRFYTFRTFLYRRTPLGKLFPKGRVLRDHLMLDWDHDDNRDVDWMIGACMLVRRRAIEEVGHMDERFFLYFEDVDWCYRMQQHGWRVSYVADSVMSHLHRRESAGGLWNRRALMHLASMIRFYDKWSLLVYRMKRRRSFVRALISLLIDIAVINGTFVLAYVLRVMLGAVFVKPVFSFSAYLPFLGFINITILLALFAVGSYRELGRLTGANLLTDTLMRGIRAAGIGYMVVTAATFLTQTQIYSRVLVTIFILLLAPLHTAGRFLLHRLYRSLQRGAYDLRRAIVVGSGDLASGISDQLRAHPDIGYDVVGIVRENADPDEEAVSLGEVEDLPRLVREHRVSDILFVGTGHPDRVLGTLLVKLSDAPVTIRVLTDLEAITLSQGVAEEFLNLPMLRFERRNLVQLRPWLKRIADFLAAAALLVLTSPLQALLLIAGLLSRPALAWEDRHDYRGYPHRIPLFHDPGTGWRGALFRTLPPLRYLPSLWSILTGSLSFVGPYPEEPEENRSMDDWNLILTRLKPGVLDVTSIADHPWVPFRDPAGLNMYYLQHWSIGLDLQIVLKEFLRVWDNEEGESRHA